MQTYKMYILQAGANRVYCLEKLSYTSSLGIERYRGIINTQLYCNGVASYVK